MNRQHPSILSSLTLLAASIGSIGCSLQPPDYLQTVSPNQLHEIMLKQDVFLVDVHTPEQKHIQGTDTFVPYDGVETYLSRLPKDKTTPIYLYCERGPMANAAARSMYELGYRNLINLEGGADAWRKAGLAFE